ncbi:MAG: ribosomal-protein-alanine N-acetyltransferase [Planctomycetota bacterium]|jgi:ribosomal-protein-alanine N-acetyltransferase
MILELISKRLKLTPLAVTDVDLAVEMFTDPDVMKFIEDELMSEKEIRQEMPTWTRRGGGGCIGIWCISDRRTGEKYGDCYLLPIPFDEDDTNWEQILPDVMPGSDVEIGYFLKKSSWGKGIATEACQRLLKFAFEETSLQAIVAMIDDEHHSSKNILKKTGFVYKGEMRAYGKDDPYFQIDRDKWLELNRGEHP